MAWMASSRNDSSEKSRAPVSFDPASTSYSRGATMSSGISKALESSTFLLPSMALILLYTVSGHTGSESPVEWSIKSHVDMQEPRVTETDTTKQNDPEVKAVLDKMAAAGINRPSTVADVRKAYLFY